MELTHGFSVPVDVDTAWEVLRDIERIAPCMPGATIESVDGEDFTGRVKVKVGPMQITYRGEASFVEVDDTAHRAVIDARGRETRGSGTANATITAHLATEAEGTRVEVVTDLAVTGKPAQFGRGVMADVGEKLIGQFADCLAEQLAGEPETVDKVPAASAEAPVADEAASAATDTPDEREGGAEIVGGVSTGAASDTAPEPAATTGAATPSDRDIAGVATPDRGAATAPARPTSDTIDLVDLAGAPVLKRLGPALAGVGVLLVMLWWLRRR